MSEDVSSPEDDLINFTELCVCVNTQYMSECVHLLGVEGALKVPKLTFHVS